MTELPKKSEASEVSKLVVAAAVSVIPIVGSPTAIILQEMFGRSFQKRRDLWFEELSDSVEELRKREDSGRLDDLEENQGFLDAVASATLLAVRTSDEAKRALLRSAVLNVALGFNYEQDKVQMFMQYMEDLTTPHVHLLEMLNDPMAYFNQRNVPWPNFSMGGISSLRELVFSNWSREYSDQILRILRNFGLVVIESMHVTQSGHSLALSTTSELGKEFLIFLKNPLE